MDKKPLFHIGINYPRLYKYTKAEFADKMINEGTFRIGTMYEYRLTTAKEIGDPDEGTKGYSFLGTPEEQRSNIDVFFRSRPDLRRNHNASELEQSLADNIPIGFVEHCPDQYLYCTTHTFDETVMRHFECDACIEIINPRFFAESLSEAMRPYAPYGTMRECVYTNRWGDWDQQNNLPADIIKPLQLQHQKEVRLIWSSAREVFLGADLDPLEHKIVKSMQAARYCRRLI